MQLRHSELSQLLCVTSRVASIGTTCLWSAWPLKGVGVRGDTVSADIHTSAPARGVTGRDNGHGGYAVLTDESAPASPASLTSRAASSLPWNRDSSLGWTAAGRPQPRMRQLMGVCGWAAVLGGLGLVVGIRGLIGDLMGLAPSWYEPSMIVVGLIRNPLDCRGLRHRPPPPDAVPPARRLDAEPHLCDGANRNRVLAITAHRSLAAAPVIAGHVNHRAR